MIYLRTKLSRDKLGLGSKKIWELGLQMQMYGLLSKFWLVNIDDSAWGDKLLLWCISCEIRLI